MRPEPLGAGAGAQHDVTTAEQAVGRLDHARRRRVDRDAVHARAQLAAEPRDRPLSAERAAARIPEQRPGVGRQRRHALAGALEHLRADAGSPQPRGVRGHVTTQPQCALRTDQRLAGAL